MSSEILINASTHEARAAVVENGVLQEVFLERASRRGLISNIYKAAFPGYCRACKRPS